MPLQHDTNIKESPPFCLRLPHLNSNRQLQAYRPVEKFLPQYPKIEFGSKFLAPSCLYNTTHLHTTCRRSIPFTCLSIVRNSLQRAIRSQCWLLNAHRLSHACPLLNRFAPIGQSEQNLFCLPRLNLAMLVSTLAMSVHQSDRSASLQKPQILCQELQKQFTWVKTLQPHSACRWQPSTLAVSSQAFIELYGSPICQSANCSNRVVMSRRLDRPKERTSIYSFLALNSNVAA